jgi:NTE family protein
MLFHLGALWRLNELALLPTLDRISAVSGGSILAAQLGLRWSRLTFVEGIATNFEAEIAEPIRRLAGSTLDAEAVVKGALLPGNASAQFASALAAALYGRATLQALPARPLIVLNATNLQTGKLWRFSRPYMGDWTIGRIPDPTVTLAKAVAASAAFPPVLSPAVFKVTPADFQYEDAGENRRPAFMQRLLLADGGVYDNLGLETAFKRCRTLFVSDAGMRPEAEEKVHTDPLRQTIRVLEVADSQVRALRKRQLLSCFKATPPTRDGAYFSSNSDIRNFGLADALPCPLERTQELAKVPTRLAKLPHVLQERLINWGYAAADAAVRAHVPGSWRAPDGFPLPSDV